MKMRVNLLSEKINYADLHNKYECILDEAIAIKNLVIKMNIYLKNF